MKARSTSRSSGAPSHRHWRGSTWALKGEVPDQSPKNPRFKAAIAVWQHLPLWLTNRVGPPIVRSIP